MKKLLFVVALLAALPGISFAGIRTYLLFNGVNTDSTEQASPWINVRAASRVVLKMWSTHVAFTASNADSTFSDSLVAMRVLLSDSLCCTVTDGWGQTLKGAADSVVFDPTTAVNNAYSDTTTTMITVRPLPINKQLRAPANGTGLVTVVWPFLTSNATVWPSDWVFTKDYMRIRVTPLRRMTVSGFSSTAGIRVNGLKGFKMIAEVYRDAANDAQGSNN